LPEFPLIFVSYACHILYYCVDASVFPPFYFYSYSPHPPAHRDAFPHCFFVVILLILPDVDLMLFITFLLLVKHLQSKFVFTSNRAGWELDPGGSGVRRKFWWEWFHSAAYGGHLCLVCAVCDVTIWRHIHISKPIVWRSLL